MQFKSKIFYIIYSLFLFSCQAQSEEDQAPTYSQQEIQEFYRHLSPEDQEKFKKMTRAQQTAIIQYNKEGRVTGNSQYNPQAPVKKFYKKTMPTKKHKKEFKESINKKSFDKFKDKFNVK